MQVSLFITCYNDTLYPETGRAVVRLLERLGVALDFNPGQTCCGQMHANTGFRAEAFSQAKRFVRLYANAEAVVIPSTSCVAMIRDQYPALMQELGNENLRKEFEMLLPRVYELSEFLVDVLRVDDVGAYFPHRVRRGADEARGRHHRVGRIVAGNDEALADGNAVAYGRARTGRLWRSACSAWSRANRRRRRSRARSRPDRARR